MIENDRISITYNAGYGHCVICVSQFFPADKGRLKKLHNKVLALDYFHRDKIKKDLIEYLQEQYEKYRDENWIRSLNSVVAERQADLARCEGAVRQQEVTVATLEDKVKAAARPDKKALKEDLKVRKKKLNDLRELRTISKESLAGAVKEADDHERITEKYKMNIEVLQELKWRGNGMEWK